MVAQANQKPDVPRVYLYRRKDGSEETESIIVDIHTAAELGKQGNWHLSPYSFLPEDKQGFETQTVVEELCQSLNGLLNMHLQSDKKEIAKLSERFLNFKPNPKMTRAAMARKVEQVARKQGKWHEDSYTVAVCEEVEE